MLANEAKEWGKIIISRRRPWYRWFFRLVMRSARYSRTWTTAKRKEEEEQKKIFLFVRVELRGNQVAQIGDVWLESAGTVVGKGGGMKRSRVSPEPNNSAPCRARLLRNKIFFFFFRLFFCYLLLTTFFSDFKKKFFFNIQPSLAVAVERNSLRSMCIYAALFWREFLCYTQQSHRYS